MANGSRILVDFPVVAAGECLVAEEVDFLVLHARQSLGCIGFGFDVAETVGLVPPGWEDVKGDLAANGVPEKRMSVEPTELFSQSLELT